MFRIVLPVCSILLATLTLIPTSRSVAAPFFPVLAPTTSRQTVNISGLNLANEHDWRVAASRVDDAAQSVCSVTNPMDTATPDDVSSCAQTARQDALRTLRDVRAEQLNNHRIGHVLLAVRPVASPHG
ncbi:UrcA family protein [Gluconobacter japonicus]|nr:UrcA family protein [Gluconobacter japonicus]